MSTALKAVLFDLDGTLYSQTPLRAAMLAELGTFGCVPRGPLSPPRLWRVLSVFRRIREELRAVEPDTIELESEQYRRAAAAAGVSDAHIRAAVAEWIFARPLKYLPLYRRRGVIEALKGLRERGLQVGVFSDYPTRAKLAALGVTPFVTLEVCATDAAVNAFKPHARGFLHACAIWGIAPDSVAYVGDRPEVDARGAVNAGMRCLIVGNAHAREGLRFERVRFTQLAAVLDQPSGPGDAPAPEGLHGIRAQ
jgi:FMN phosphatase YigB (HAD superfamily)